MKKILLIIGLVLLLPFSALAMTMADFGWNVVYDGYGSVQINSDSGQAELQPMAAIQPGETHAALVLNDTPLNGNYKVEFDVENIEQLRKGSTPNPWEAPWFVFGYKPGTNGVTSSDRTFSYVILKPNGYGLELGEALPSNGQNFLWTSSVGADSYNVGQAYHVELVNQDEVLTLNVDGVQKFIFSDVTRRQLTSDGYFGFYAEDAHVKYSNLQVTQLSNPESTTPQAPVTEKKRRVKNRQRK